MNGITTVGFALGGAAIALLGWIGYNTAVIVHQLRER